MAYNKTSWTDGETALNATHLNNIETGIENNEQAIITLLGGMHFKGLFNRNTQLSNPNIGDVYQAEDSGVIGSRSYKIGDLIVYINPDNTTPYWHVIPSGDETSGTVTSIIAGNGINIGGGPITTSGTIQLDEGYIANSSHSGLMSSEMARKVNNLATVAESGSYNDLTDKPTAFAPAPDIPINPEEASSNITVSQKALSTKFASVANVQHVHNIADITSLSSRLKPDNGNDTAMVDHVAPAIHSHGNINSDGRLTGNYTSSVKYYLSTNGVNGEIIGNQTIPSSVISGTQFSGRNLDTYYTKIDDMYANFPRENDDTSSSSTELVKAASADHTHDNFSLAAPGFVPPPPDGSREYSLRSTGWHPLPENFIDLVYPPGSYYETSLKPFPAGKEAISDITAEDRQSLGQTWFNPNIAWGGLWKREVGGVVHVSAAAKNSSWVMGDNQTTGPDIDREAKGLSSFTQCVGVADGGASTVKLTAEQCALRNHTHSIKPIKFYVRRGADHPTIMSGGAGKTGVTVVLKDDTYSSAKTTTEKAKDKVETFPKTTTTKEFPSSVSINLQAKSAPTTVKESSKSSTAGTRAKAIAAHDNMPPYIKVFRWHRIDWSVVPSYNPTAVITANNFSKVYGENDPNEFTVVITGPTLLTEEMKNQIQYSVSREEGDDVGTYDLIPMAANPQTLDNIVFDISTVPGTLTITKRPIYIKADDMAYDDIDEGGGNLTYSIYTSAQCDELYRGLLTEEDIMELDNVIQLSVGDNNLINISLEDDEGHTGEDAKDSVTNLNIAGVIPGRVL